MQLMAPTIRTLREIAEHPDSAAVLAAAEQREIRPIIPRVIRRDGGGVVRAARRRRTSRSPPITSAAVGRA